ncbi:MAG TPA: IS110 family transposase [Opitutaceae bacterium]
MKDTEYRGIDVSKFDLEVDALKSKRVANSTAGLKRLFSELPANVHLVCEATGGYENALLQAAWAAQRPISLVMPNRVRAFARSEGKFAKTDPLDAALITRFAKERRPEPTPAPSLLRQDLRALLRAREHVLALLRHEANHREHLRALPLLQTQSEQRVQSYHEQIKALEEQIRALIATDAQVRSQISRMQQVKSVGEIVAWTVWADLPELGQLEKGEAASLCGLAPHPNDSGQKKGHRFIQHGRATLRRVLYMAAVSAIRHNHILKAFYQRLRSNGKPAKLALIALARKLIELLNLIIKNPNFVLAH